MAKKGTASTQHDTHYAMIKSLRHCNQIRAYIMRFIIPTLLMSLTLISCSSEKQSHNALTRFYDPFNTSSIDNSISLRECNQGSVIKENKETDIHFSIQKNGNVYIALLLFDEQGKNILKNKIIPQYGKEIRVFVWADKSAPATSKDEFYKYMHNIALNNVYEVVIDDGDLKAIKK